MFGPIRLVLYVVWMFGHVDLCMWIYACGLVMYIYVMVRVLKI
jgi:hypothetical protein